MDDLNFKTTILENWKNAREGGYYDDTDFTWEDVALDMIAFAADVEEYLETYGEDELVKKIVAVLEHTE